MSDHYQERKAAQQASGRRYAVGDRVTVCMMYGEETVTITAVDADALGFDVRDDSGCTFWIAVEDVLV